MKNILLVFSLLLLFACTRDQQPVEAELMPADSIIPEGEMVLLLADVHIIEAALTIERNRGQDADSLANYYYSGVFKKYRISRKRYQENLEYYRKDPDGFFILYGKVNKELIDRETNFVKPKSR